MYLKIKWWQLIFYEIALVSLGIIIGAYWEFFFSDYLYFLLFLFAVCGGYTLYIFTNQFETSDNKKENNKK